MNRTAEQRRNARTDAVALIVAHLNGDAGIQADILLDWLDREPEARRRFVRMLLWTTTTAGSSDPEGFVNNLELLGLTSVRSSV